MKTFGSYITSIENTLLESYKNDTFKDNMKKFNANVIKNKSVAKAYMLYNNLLENRGFKEEYAKEYLNEAINIIRNLSSKPEVRRRFAEGENQYSDIDTILWSDNIEEVVDAKRRVIKTLTKEKVVKETIQIPLSMQLSIANKSLKPILESMSEDELELINDIKRLPSDKLSKLVENTKEEIVSFLKESVDETTLSNVENKLSSYSNDDYTSLIYLRKFNREIQS